MPEPHISPTSLGYAVLAILNQSPRSGYAVRQVFEQKDLGGYSSSPGSIYPALNALSRLGYVVKSKNTDEKSEVYKLTPTGKARLVEWLSAPVTDVELFNGQSGGLMRFTLLQLGGHRKQAKQFLKSFQSAAHERAQGIKARIDATEDQDIHLRLRLQHERLILETGSMWARHTRRTLFPPPPVQVNPAATEAQIHP